MEASVLFLIALSYDSPKKISVFYDRLDFQGPMISSIQFFELGNLVKKCFNLICVFEIVNIVW